MKLNLLAVSLRRGANCALVSFGLSAAILLAGEAQAQNQPPAPQDDGVTIQLPGNPVSEVLSLYERLTGKHLVRDANLSGPNLTVVVPGKVSKAEAISLLESALLLNGYTLVPVNDNTVKVIGTGKSPLGEGIPLYANASLLPSGEQVISYFMLLKYISTKDAMAVFAGYVSLRQQGRMVEVPNSNAIVITDNSPLIRRLIGLQHLIDVPGAKVLTEFVTLTRADAEKVADTINTLLEQEKKDDNQSTARAIAGSPAPQVQPGAAQDPAVPPPGGSGGSQPLVQTATPMQVIADVRTNRVLVVASESKMTYIKNLIFDLDKAVGLEQPLERPLKFISAGDVLPVLQSILAEGEDEGKGQTTQGQTPGQSQGEFRSSGGTSSSGGGTSKPDKLTAPQESVAPMAVSVGKIRIIADRSANKIIVIGPPESRSKAARVLDMLDQRPKQVYLATVIGQLTLGEDMNLGVQYPGSVSGSLYVAGGNGGNGGAVVTSSNNGRTTDGGVDGGIVNNGGVDILPGTGQLMNTAINLVAGSLSGLSIYGVLADSIDITVHALEATNRFEIISRPVVYTANNKKAVISSGQQVPVPQSTLTSSLSSDVQGSSIASTIQYKDVVLKLEVIPLINSKDEVTLNIAQQNDNIIQTVTISGNQVPVLGTQELTTTVTVPNRHTVVIGGLITEEDQNDTTGLPLLSRIPGFQYLFGTKHKNKVRRELVILIQPFIVDSPEAESEANYIQRANSSMNGQLYEDEIPVRKAIPVIPSRPAPANWRPQSAGGSTR